MKPEDTGAERTQLAQPQVDAALAYYYANEEVIDPEIAAYYKSFEYLEVKYQSGQ